MAQLDRKEAIRLFRIRLITFTLSLVFIYAIQRSPYGFNLKWKHIKPLISYMFGDEIFEKLKDGRVISTYADDNILEIINIPNIRYNISDSEKEILFHKFIDYVSGHSLITGLIKIMYLDRKFAQFLMDLLNQNPQKTSDDFINSSTFPITNSKPTMISFAIESQS